INDTLQFIATEEGRARPDKANAQIVYDYMLRDHLGNIRMILTEESRTDMYPAATMEWAAASLEETYYSNLPATRTAVSGISGYPANTPQGNAQVSKVNGNGNKIGPAITLKVMAGDKFNLRVNSWYKLNGATPGSPVNPVADLANALANGVGVISDGHG